MFCTKCGNNVTDGVRFCTSCGAPMTQGVNNGMLRGNYNMQSYGTSAVSVMKKPINMKVIVAVGGAIAVIAAVVVLLIVLLGGTKQAALDRYVKGMNTGDPNKVLSAMLPLSKHEQYAKEHGYESKKDLISKTKESYKALENRTTYKAKLLEKVEFDESYKNWVYEYLSDYGIVPSKIERHKVRLTETYKGESETDEEELIFYKYKGRWYLIE